MLPPHRTGGAASSDKRSVALVLPPELGGAALGAGGGAARGARHALPRHAGVAAAVYRLLHQGISISINQLLCMFHVRNLLCWLLFII